MNEQYLEWLFLREHLIFWINHEKCIDGGVQYYFDGKEYDIEKMKKRYLELTKLLLKDYEL